MILAQDKIKHIVVGTASYGIVTAFLFFIVKLPIIVSSSLSFISLLTSAIGWEYFWNYKKLSPVDCNDVVAGIIFPSILYILILLW